MTTQGEDTPHMPERRRRAAFLTLPTASSSDVRRGDFGPAALPGATLALRVPRSGAPFTTGGTSAFPVHTAADASGAAALRRERKSASASPPPEDEDNPFAAPPEGRPEQAWRPRGQRGGSRGPDEGQGPDGSNGSGDTDSSDGSGNDGDGARDDGRKQSQWGSQWSSRQPGRQSGSFGGGPGDRRANGGQGGGPGGPAGLRWDPTDPMQRRARYALLAGMWGFFFALFSLPEIALLLGALAMYWGISSLRGRSARPRGGAGANPNDIGTSTAPSNRSGAGGQGAGGGSPQSSRPQTTAAISGLVTGGLALAIVAATFTFQLVYRDYYACVDDALTTSSRQSCEDLLPKQLRPLLNAED
ncbi:hypothetical protein [Streptomyces sp. NPDC051776]|uniref:hypothetical protein n=1 Tax=Streptomyces sp. NPDC051776 TaxID=3155414 RepID=UPI003429C0FF